MISEYLLKWFTENSEITKGSENNDVLAGKGLSLYMLVDYDKY